MKTNKGYEDLEVWQFSRSLASEIYKVVGNFKKEDLFTLGDQIRRSAISIPSNVAEGACRGSSKEFVRFIMIASGSAAELRTQLFIAKDNNLLDEVTFQRFDSKLDQIGKMLKGLERAMKSKINQPITNNK
jgi:four helix bundle protein